MSESTQLLSQQRRGKEGRDPGDLAAASAGQAEVRAGPPPPPPVWRAGPGPPEVGSHGGTGAEVLLSDPSWGRGGGGAAVSHLGG